MGLKSGDLLVDELIRRLTNLDRTTALNALNRAQRWCLRQGSYQFMMGGPLPLSGTLRAAPQQTAIATVNGAIDPGKAKMIFNSADGTPVRHVAWSDFWQSLNYNIPNNATYDTYTMQTLNTNGDPAHTIYLLPNISADIEFYYHRISTGLSDAPNSYSDLPSDFDDLLVDLAEAEERRIYDIGDSWQLLLTRSQDQIKLMLDGYRSESQQETGLTDASVKSQETTQLGRN